MTVDGRILLRKLLKKRIRGPLKFGLYTWRGGASFDSVRVSTRKRAAPIPSTLLEKLEVSTDTVQRTNWICDFRLPPMCGSVPVQEGLD